MVLRTRTGFDATKFFIALLVSFVAIQLGSYILSEVLGYELLKMGWILLLFLVVIGITSLFVLGRKLGQLDLKRDLPFMLLVFGGIIAAFYFLPKYLPQIFSTISLEAFKEIDVAIKHISTIIFP